jgi:hypothetical protein
MFKGVENMKTKTKIVRWFEKWYAWSWDIDSDEIREIKEILKELK